MRSVKYTVYLTVVAAGLFLPLSRTAWATQPLFASHDTLSVRIEAPFTTLMKDRPDEEYLDGFLYYFDTEGAEHKLDLKLQTRGRYRRQKKTCIFAPLRLNFRKGQVQGSVFDGQDKLKLITHCQTRKRNYEQLVLREFLAYRMLQVLTDKSLQTRLMRITYVDSEGRADTITRYGFVTEDDGNAGDRIGLSPYKGRGIDAAELDPRQANLVALFQYLIGNTDFSLILGPLDDRCCHNSYLFSDDGAPYTPVPYDFDFSGLVNAPYAEPNPRFKIRRVTTRLYRGRCMNNERLDETITYFLQKEAELRDLASAVEGFDSRSQKSTDKFVDGFFAVISNPEAVQRKLIRECS